MTGPTAIPLPFECVYAAKVSNPRAWERVLHEVFSEARVNRKREFFHSEITAKASLILQTAKVEDVTHMAPSVAANDETPSESKRNSDGRRDNFNFEMLGIETGSLLQFFSDETVVCKVTQLKPPRVLYAGEEMTVNRGGGGSDGARFYKRFAGAAVLEVSR